MDFKNTFFNLAYNKLTEIKNLLSSGSGGWGGVDQTARDMAQAAQNTADNKANKIVQQIQVS